MTVDPETVPPRRVRLLRHLPGARHERASEDPVESLVRRAAGLLRAGVPAGRVWWALSTGPFRGVLRKEDPGLPASVAEALRGGAEAADALARAEGAEWRVLAATWRLAETSGAPMAAGLDRFARSLHSLHQLSERRSVLLAGPRATIRLVAALPAVALLLGMLLGFNPLGALHGPVAWASLALGVLLLALGVHWASALTRRVARTDWVAGWEFELAAIALAGGAPPTTGRRWAIECADRAAAEWVRLELLGPGGPVARSIESAEALGSPMVPLLLGEAERSRDQAQAELERAAERLGVGVLVPLGVCVLPAFLLLGVVPVLLAVLGGAGGAW